MTTSTSVATGEAQVPDGFVTNVTSRRLSIRVHQGEVLDQWRTAMSNGDDLQIEGLVNLAHALRDADALLGSEVV